MSGEAGTLLGGQYAPSEDAIYAFEGRVITAAFEQIFEGGVEDFGGCEGEDELNLGVVTGRAQLIFSR